MVRTLTLLLPMALACGARVAKTENPETTPSHSDTATRAAESDLVMPTLWAELPQADDPYPSHRPDTLDCDSDGWHEEAGVLEVETNLCPYVNLVQPTQDDVLQGDTLSLLTYHSALSAVDQPAEAHLAVLIDGVVLIDKIIPIPSASEIYDDSVIAQHDFAAGTPVVLHLHNHGGNAWKLAHLKRTDD